MVSHLKTRRERERVRKRFSTLCSEHGCLGIFFLLVLATVDHTSVMNVIYFIQIHSFLEVTPLGMAVVEFHEKGKRDFKE